VKRRQRFICAITNSKAGCNPLWTGIAGMQDTKFELKLGRTVRQIFTPAPSIMCCPFTTCKCLIVLSVGTCDAVISAAS
jgi:hypothetical protein